MLLLILSVACRAEDPINAAQVAAARTEALDALRREIMAAQLLPDLTVQAFVDKASGSPAISKALFGAQQVGGPRWIDDQTCQVTVSISGEDLVNTLVRIAESKPKVLSITPSALRDKLKRWKTRSFSAVGTSLGWSAVDRLRPDPTQTAWQTVSDADRRKAIDAAKQAAVQNIIDSLKPLNWDAGRTLTEALALPEVNQDLRKWLGSRPITAVQFRDNLEIRLALSVSPLELWPTLKDALQHQKALPQPAKPADWMQLRQQLETKMAPPIGSSNAIAGAAAPLAVTIPTDPPAWVNQAIEADGVATAAGSALRTARAAETAANQQLRTKINALNLAPGLTLGDAAKQDPRIEQALARGLRAAQISKVDYDSPARGSVHTKLTMNLEDLWRELASR